MIIQQLMLRKYEVYLWSNDLNLTMNHIILRNTAVRGFEPLISKVTISRLNQLSHTTWEDIASTLSVGVFLGNETHQTISKGEGCGGRARLHNTQKL